MIAWLNQPKFRNSPIRVWILVTAVISITEAAVMFVLPSLLPADPSLVLGAIIDSVLLTIVISPLLWWFVERPLRTVNTIRDEFLSEYFARTEAEQRHIAIDLHDGVGQWLTLLISGLKSAESLKLDAECAQRLADLKEIAASALRDVKRLALGLRPSVLDDLGLGPALERVVVELSQHQAITLTLDTSGLQNQRLPETIETAIFRIAQESLANIVKHSHAGHASMTVRYSGGAVELEVKDDGIGIPEQFLRGANGSHLGLTSMRERATLLGGRLEVVSNPGQGTSIFVRIPTEVRL
jgi:signal transduction histidine kinase